METKLFEKLDDLNVRDTNLLLEKDIILSLDHLTIKRIEKSVKRKIGYYNSNNLIKQKINDILGGIIMKRKIALVLTVIAVSSLGGGVYAHAKTTPVAYVSVDINPSVELGVNAFDEVISAEAYNEDGEKVLEGTDLVNSDVEDAVNTVITNAVSEGYINEDGTSAIEITTSTDKEEVAAELEESLKETADTALENNEVEATVETQNVALARRDEARQLGITPGKLNLIQKLQALDPTIKVEDYASSSVKDIQKKTKELKKMNKVDETTTNTNSDVNTDATTNVVTEENLDNTSKNKGNSQKDEKSNLNSKKEESIIVDEQEKDKTNKTDKTNNSNDVNSQNKSDNKEKNKNN